ncbi:hypothetical protein [Actinoplanes sp. NPDC023714]|uniref:hypothetical protein n=1 Tax=Actinoplanes sp. NPDC023714 TaxID=3154322 RepID=UPI0033EF52AB
MIDERQRATTPWRPVAVLVGGAAMIVVALLYQPQGTGWRLGLQTLLTMFGAGLLVDGFRSLRRGRK